MTSSSRMVLRTLEDTDYANTKSLMSERFSRGDVDVFKSLWKWRNFSASLCIEKFGAILGFGLVVDNKIEYLAVSDHFGGRGMGQILVSYITEILEEEGYKSIHLMTANDPLLCRWYRRLGFEVITSASDRQGIWGAEMVYRFRTKRVAAARHKFCATR